MPTNTPQTLVKKLPIYRAEIQTAILKDGKSIHREKISFNVDAEKESLAQIEAEGIARSLTLKCDVGNIIATGTRYYLKNTPAIKFCGVTYPKDAISCIGNYGQSIQIDCQRHGRADHDYFSLWPNEAACQNAAKTDWKRHFGWYRGVAIEGHHTTKTTFGMVQNFFLDTIENAVSLDEFIDKIGPLKVTFWQKMPGEQFGRCVQHGVVETEQQILDTFAEIRTRKDFDGGPWLEPLAERSIIENITDTVAVKGDVKGTVARVRIHGHDKPMYVKRTFPLVLTENPLEATGFPKKLLDKLWHAVDAASGYKLREIRWMTFQEAVNENQ